jgi:RNA polymerase sigma-70 factor (ECF subfamily)
VRDVRDDRRDRPWLRDIAADTAGALGALYDAHAGSLYRHALALTRRRSDAEDLVQAVFVKVATMGGDLVRVHAPAAYLHRTLHTMWIDGRRRAQTAERVRSDAETPTHLPAPAREDAIDLARALDVLPADQRAVAILHLVEGFSFREIGRLTGVSLFTAAARYRLALGRLRRALAVPVRGRP